MMEQRRPPPENAFSAAIEPALKIGAACGESHLLLLFRACLGKKMEVKRPRRKVEDDKHRPSTG